MTLNSAGFQALSVQSCRVKRQFLQQPLELTTFGSIEYLQYFFLA